MKRNRTNTLSILTCILLSFVFLAAAQAQIKEVTVQVMGLSCPFCVKGVEKQLKKVDGVAKVSTSLKKGQVNLQYKAGATLDIDRTRKAIVKGGFTPGEMHLTAVGTVVNNGHILFMVNGTENSFLLHGDPSAGGSLSNEMAAQIEKAAEVKESLQITGKVHLHKGELPGLQVDGLQPIEKKGLDG